MYAQTPRPTDIPRNYSGNAFRYPPIGSLGEQAERDDVPPGERQDTVKQAVEAAPRQEETASAVVQEQAVTPILPFLPAFSGGGGGFLQSIGSEELLLIGLFLLLSGSEGGQASDVLFYLLLLLFCG